MTPTLRPSLAHLTGGVRLNAPAVLIACAAWLVSGASVAASTDPNRKGQAGPSLQRIAEQVMTGDVLCEGEQWIVIEPAPRRPGLFQLFFEEERYLMAPVVSNSGAVRLEDKQRGMMWLQIGSKSMLMDERTHERVADNCIHPRQREPAPGRTLLIAPADERGALAR